MQMNFYSQSSAREGATVPNLASTFKQHCEENFFHSLQFTQFIRIHANEPPLLSLFECLDFVNVDCCYWCCNGCCNFLVACYTTLHSALSVRPSLSPYVGPSVDPSVGPSVELYFFGFSLRSLTSLLLPK